MKGQLKSQTSPARAEENGRASFVREPARDGKTPLLLVKRHNRRDNLGDEIIFESLVKAVDRYGDVMLLGSTPMDHFPATGGFWPLCKIVGGAIRHGRPIYAISPPGATHHPQNRLIRLAVRAGVHRCIPGSLIILGRSVVPGKDYSDWRRFRWVGARDDASIEALRNAGCPRVTYFPDCAFLLEPAFDDGSPRVDIGLSFRSRIGEGLQKADYERTIRLALSRIVERLSQEDRSRLVGFHQVEEDASFVHDLCAKFRVDCRSDRLTLSTYGALYRRTGVVISNRLHCLLLGALCGALPIALTVSAHTKLDSLFKTVGWEQLLVDAGDADCAERVAAILTKRGSLLRMVQESWRREHQTGLRLLQDEFTPR